MGESIHQLSNFRSFGNAVSLLFRGITGESWNGVMKDSQVTHDSSLLLRFIFHQVNGHECTDFYGQTTDGWGDLSIVDVSKIKDDDYFWINDCGNYYLAPFYWILFMMVANYAVLNLFIAVILDNFAFCANCENAEIS